MILDRSLRQIKSVFYGLSGSLWTGDSDDMVALHAADGTFLKVSASAATITGYKPSELLGLSLANITTPDDRGEALGALVKTCSMGKKGRAEFCLLRADGHPIWAEMTASRDAGGHIRTVIRDINARKMQELEVSSQTPLIHTDYLADLSHEIRTPLNAVIGFADAMKNQTFGPIGHAKYEEYAGLIHKSGEHLLSLVTSLLDLSKIEADKYTLTREDVDIAELLDECASMMSGATSNTGLWLRRDIDETTPLVRLDAQAMRQMVLNLLSNAIKFTKAGGVTLKLRYDTENLWISVVDTGLGMNEEQLAKIGKRFEQAHGQGVRGAKGTGLGLALCHGLADLHNGELRFESREGQGTKATLRLPIIEAHNARTTSFTPSLSAFDTSSDDEPMISVLDNLKRKSA